MNADFTPPEDDPCGPPAEPCECWCLHCRRTFMSTGIWWQARLLPGGKRSGFWLCPTPNCDGAGFTIDLFPTDPEHPANAGWSGADGDDDDDPEWDEQDIAEWADDDAEAAADGLDGEFADADEPYDPAEPKYAALDDEAAMMGDTEGEEWKHGTGGVADADAGGPEPDWMSQMRAERDREQARYDAPDERPRVIDESNRPAPPPSTPGDGWEEQDIPF